MSKWVEKHFDDFAILNYGDNLPSTALKPYGYKVFGANGFIGFNDTYNLEKQTVLISCRGENSGTINIVPEKTFVTNNSIPVVIKTKDVDTIFLFYKLQTLRRDQMVSGSAQPQVTINDLKKIKIVFPSFPEQRQIATILSTADAVIEKTQAAIAKYKAIKQGMLQDLFTRGIDTTIGKLRPTYQEVPELYKESKLGWIPKEWEEKDLMHYLSFISYGFTNPMPETEEGPYLITAANVNFGKIQYETCRKTSQVAFDTLLTDKSKPRVNDILLTKDGTLGRIALVEREDLCINQSVAVLRPKALIYPLFLKLLLESESYQKTMIDEAGGSTIKHIYITIVDKMAIAIPQNMNEQIEIALRIKTIDNKIKTEQDFLHKHQQIKAGLMNDLLSGMKKVKFKENQMA